MTKLKVEQLNARIDPKLLAEFRAATCVRSRSEDCPNRTVALEEAISDWLAKHRARTNGSR